MSKNISVLIDNAQPPFSERLTRSLCSVGVDAQLFDFRKPAAISQWVRNLQQPDYQICHFLWGDNPPAYYILPKLLGKKVVIHWVGTDALRAATAKKLTARQRFYRFLAYRMADLHLAVSQPLASELRPLGIKAQVIPLVPDPPAIDYSKLPWPSDNRVCVYLPEARQEFYGASTVWQLAAAMPDVRFLIVAHSGKNAPQLPNIEYLGYINNMETVWKQVKVYLRLTQHDGMPQSLIEALSRGRYVIWSGRHIHCYHPNSFEGVQESLDLSLAHTQPNSAGAAYALRQYNPTALAVALKEHYERIL